MQKLFTKILVPVAFNRNTRWATEKAVQLANKFECDVLLLHVQAPPVTLPFLSDSLFPGSFLKSLENDRQGKMKELEQQVKPKLKEGLLISSMIVVGYWQSVLKDVIITEHIDLTLIPRNHRRISSAIIQRININKLSQQTNCPIMTLTRTFNASRLQNIVVPVNDLLPVKKLTMATYLSLDTSGHIYLMGVEKNALAKNDEGYLLRAYQLLNEFGRLNIHCVLQDSYDPAAGTLAYAKDVHADLIVINPGQESRLRGWWNKLRGKHLCRESEIPVMTVSF